MPAVKKKAAKSNETPVPFIDVGQLPAVLAVLAYGRSGTGKTTFASTFPKPLLLLDVREKGTDSVSNVKGIKVGEINTWVQFEEVYWYLANGSHSFKTVVIDQISQLQDLAIAHSMKEDGKDPEKDGISKRNWGQAASLLKTWILNYRDLIDQGIHVVFLAHDRVSSGEGEESGGEDQIDPVVGARVMPSVASFLNGAVKIIGNTFISESHTIENKRRVRSVHYSMRLGPHAFFTTKTRSPVGIAAPDVVTDPSYEQLVAIMQGTYSKPATNVTRKKG